MKKQKPTKEEIEAAAKAKQKSIRDKKIIQK